MKYFKITCSNGFVGCDEVFYTSAEDEIEAGDKGVDILENMYSFAEPDDRFLDYDPDDKYDYLEALDWYYDNLEYWVEEISLGEYIENTGGWKI